MTVEMNNCEVEYEESEKLFDLRLHSEDRRISTTLRPFVFDGWHAPAVRLQLCNPYVHRYAFMGRKASCRSSARQSESMATVHADLCKSRFVTCLELVAEAPKLEILVKKKWAYYAYMYAFQKGEKSNLEKTSRVHAEFTACMGLLLSLPN
ncbi:hypothetical protein T4A_13100, partial [Trichinella pseudospiralis]